MNATLSFINCQKIIVLNRWNDLESSSSSFEHTQLHPSNYLAVVVVKPTLDRCCLCTIITVANDLDGQCTKVGGTRCTQDKLRPHTFLTTSIVLPHLQRGTWPPRNISILTGIFSPLGVQPFFVCAENGLALVFSTRRIICIFNAAALLSWGRHPNTLSNALLKLL